MPRTSRITPGRVLVGLLVVMNVVLCVVLLRWSQRDSARQGGRLEGEDRAAGARPQVRAARHAGQATVGVRRPADDDTTPAELDPSTPPDDPEDAFDRLVALARPRPQQKQVMREAFDRHYPKAEAAHRAGDRVTATAAWRAYCDEIEPSFDESKLKKLGCLEAPPP